MAFWQSVVENLEQIALWTSIVVASLGLFAFLVILLGWTWIANRYGALYAKIPLACFRFVAAASAIAAKVITVKTDTPLTEQPWLLTILTASGGYLLWELTSLIGDHKYTLAKEKTKAQYEQEVKVLTQDKNDATQQCIRLGRLLSQLGSPVNQKLQRVKEVASATAGSRASIQQVRDGLDPNIQIAMILECLALLCRLEVISLGGSHRQNFRVGLYAEDAGTLVPIDAFDLNTRSHDPFTSYRQHSERFRLDNEINPSHAVRCVIVGRLLIVPDCATHPEFRFFHTQQPNYLRSLVAFPLPEFSMDGISPVKAALLIDTDVTGYFQEKDREIVESSLIEFATRIKLEYAIKGLLK